MPVATDYKALFKGVIWMLEQRCVGGWLPKYWKPTHAEALVELKDQREYDEHGAYRVRKYTRVQRKGD